MNGVSGNSGDPVPFGRNPYTHTRNTSGGEAGKSRNPLHTGCPGEKKGEAYFVHNPK